MKPLVRSLTKDGKNVGLLIESGPDDMATAIFHPNTDIPFSPEPYNLVPIWSGPSSTFRWISRFWGVEVRE